MPSEASSNTEKEELDGIEDDARPSKVHCLVGACRYLVHCTQMRVAEDDWETWDGLQWLADQFEIEVWNGLEAEGDGEWVVPHIQALAIFTLSHGLAGP